MDNSVDNSHGSTSAAQHRERPSRRKRPSQADYDHSPYVAFYEVTRACDLVCLHCRACAQARPDPRELDTQQSFALIEQLAEFPRPPIFVLTGGDPFKRSDLFSLIDKSIACGLETSITPSATPLVTLDALVRLRDHGVARLAVSLDGVDAASHDAVRGVAGSFQRTLEIAADARRCGLEVQVNTTLTPTNVGQIEAIAALLAGLDIVLWSVFFLVPVGRAGDLPRLDAEQSEAAFAQLWRVAQTHPFGIKTTEAPHYRRFIAQAAKLERRSAATSPNKPTTDKPTTPKPTTDRADQDGESTIATPSRRFRPLGTNDGKGIMFIGHTGEIYPSGFLPIRCGQFPHDDVVSVYQHAPLFRQLRDADNLQGKCGQCEFRNLCGGSRARAFAVTANPFAEEPDCVYRPTDVDAAKS